MAIGYRVAAHAVTSRNVFVIEVDWSGDGDFADANEDVTADVLAFQCSAGRDQASQLLNRASTGRAQIVLLNDDGKYSSFNSSSPIYGNILPKRKIRIRSTSPTAATLWTGFLTSLIPQAAGGGQPTAILTASGPFTILGDRANLISPAPQTNALTSAIVTAILDAAGWPGGDRIIDTGVVPVGDWFVEAKVALEALQEIEDTEFGFLHEGIVWDVVFESRYYRILTAASNTSQGTFSDAAGAGLSYLDDAEQEDPLLDIFNRITATITPYSSVGLAVLWTLIGETPTLAPAESITYIAKVSSGYVSAWTTPVVGTDITQTGVTNGDIGVAVVKNATTMKMTITNNHATLPATLTLVQARGTARTPGNPFQVTSEDSTSQTKYGPRAYPLPSPWYSGSAYAKPSCDYFVSRQKDPSPKLLITLPASSDDTLFSHAVQRKLSDRITVVASGLLTEFGINRDFWIESIAHRWQAGGALETSWKVSPCPTPAINYWVLGTSTLGDNTVLAY